MGFRFGCLSKSLKIMGNSLFLGGRWTGTVDLHLLSLFSLSLAYTNANTMAAILIFFFWARGRDKFMKAQICVIFNRLANNRTIKTNSKASKNSEAISRSASSSLLVDSEMKHLRVSKWFEKCRQQSKMRNIYTNDFSKSYYIRYKSWGVNHFAST